MSDEDWSGRASMCVTRIEALEEEKREILAGCGLSKERSQYGEEEWQMRLDMNEMLLEEVEEEIRIVHEELKELEKDFEPVDVVWQERLTECEMRLKELKVRMREVRYERRKLQNHFEYEGEEWQDRMDENDTFLEDLEGDIQEEEDERRRIGEFPCPIRKEWLSDIDLCEMTVWKLGDDKRDLLTKRKELEEFSKRGEREWQKDVDMWMTRLESVERCLQGVFRRRTGLERLAGYGDDEWRERKDLYTLELREVRKTARHDKEMIERLAYDAKLFWDERWVRSENAETNSIPKVDEGREVRKVEKKEVGEKWEEEWKEEVRTAFRKLEEERPLELESDPREEVETRYKLYRVPFGGSEWPELERKNDLAHAVVWEEEFERERGYMRRWEDEVRETYLRERKKGVLLTTYSPWGQLVARRKTELLLQVACEEELKEKRASYLLLEEGKKEEEERCIREAYPKLEEERPLSLYPKRGVVRRARLDEYRSNVNDWERYVGNRKTVALRRITLEEEAKRGRAREVWEREEVEEPVQKCSHPVRYDKFLWDTEPKCPHCGWDHSRAGRAMVAREAHDDEESRREGMVYFVRNLAERRRRVEEERAMRILVREKREKMREGRIVPLVKEEVEIRAKEREKRRGNVRVNF